MQFYQRGIVGVSQCFDGPKSLRLPKDTFCILKKFNNLGSRILELFDFPMFEVVRLNRSVEPDKGRQKHLALVCVST